MPDLSALKDNPTFREGVFLFAVILILGAWKFGIEGVLE